MGYYFESDSKQGFILYSIDKHIMLRRIQSEYIYGSIYLAHDFKSDLTAVKIDNTIYYAYITSGDAIVLKNVSANEYILKIEPYEKYETGDTQITFFNNLLIVVFSFKEKGHNIWNVKYVVINDGISGKVLTLDDSSNDTFRLIVNGLTDRPQISLLNTTEHLPIIIQTDNKPHIYELRKDMSIFSHDESTSSMERQNLLYLDKIKQLHENINQLRQANLLLMNKISELSEDNKALLENFNNTKKALAIRKSQIESAKTQYNELMDVASKYRDEAIKWRMKLTKR